jgi:hypothetical protein
MEKREMKEEALRLAEKFLKKTIGAHSVACAIPLVISIFDFKSAWLFLASYITFFVVTYILVKIVIDFYIFAVKD